MVAFCWLIITAFNNLPPSHIPRTEWFTSAMHGYLYLGRSYPLILYLSVIKRWNVRRWYSDTCRRSRSTNYVLVASHRSRNSRVFLSWIGETWILQWATISLRKYLLQDARRWSPKVPDRFSRSGSIALSSQFSAWTR